MGPNGFICQMIISDKNKCDHMDLKICPYTHHPDSVTCIHCLAYLLKSAVQDQERLEQETCAQKENTPKIAYICDRRACEKCSYPDCVHTLDITHAADFVKDGAGNFMEE